MWIAAFCGRIIQTFLFFLSRGFCLDSHPLDTSKVGDYMLLCVNEYLAGGRIITIIIISDNTT